MPGTIYGSIVYNFWYSIIKKKTINDQKNLFPSPFFLLFINPENIPSQADTLYTNRREEVCQDMARGIYFIPRNSYNHRDPSYKPIPGHMVEVAYCNDQFKEYKLCSNGVTEYKIYQTQYKEYTMYTIGVKEDNSLNIQYKEDKIHKICIIPGLEGKPRPSLEDKIYLLLEDKTLLIKEDKICFLHTQQEVRPSLVSRSSAQFHKKIKVDNYPTQSWSWKKGKKLTITTYFIYILHISSVCICNQ